MSYILILTMGYDGDPTTTDDGSWQLPKRVLSSNFFDKVPRESKVYIHIQEIYFEYLLVITFLRGGKIDCVNIN